MIAFIVSAVVYVVSCYGQFL